MTLKKTMMATFYMTLSLWFLTGARSYEIVLLHNNVALTIQTVQATRFTFSSLNPGTLYDVRVTALNANDKKSSSVSHQQRTGKIIV